MILNRTLDRTLDKLSRALPVGLVLISMAAGLAPSRSEPIGVDPTVGGADTPSPKLADDRARGNPLWAIPLNTLTATRGRPIFSPSRRPPPPAIVAAPYVPPPVAATPAEPDRPQLMLVGTVTGDTEAFGIFLDQSVSKIVRLKLGDLHSGWILRQVRGREVMLQRNDEIIFLALPPPGTKPAVSGTQVADEPEQRLISR
jgi:general secretion pathway protein N